MLLSDSLPETVLRAADDHGCSLVDHPVELQYRNFKADEVLNELLPDGVETPRAFEAVGHIAHVNLRDEHLPYKHLIGQVLLDKNHPSIRSVVNKVCFL